MFITPHQANITSMSQNNFGICGSFDTFPLKIRVFWIPVYTILPAIGHLASVKALIDNLCCSISEASNGCYKYALCMQKRRVRVDSSVHWKWFLKHKVVCIGRKDSTSKRICCYIRLKPRIIPYAHTWSKWSHRTLRLHPSWSPTDFNIDLAACSYALIKLWILQFCSFPSQYHPPWAVNMWRLSTSFKSIALLKQLD